MPEIEYSKQNKKSVKLFDKFTILSYIYLSSLICIAFIVLLILSIIFSQYSYIWSMLINIPFILLTPLINTLISNWLLNFGKSNYKNKGIIIFIGIVFYTCKFIILFLGVLIGFLINIYIQHIFDPYALIFTILIYPITILLTVITFKNKKQNKINK